MSTQYILGTQSYFSIALGVIGTYIFQIPLDMNEFRTNDADALPLLHFILRDVHQVSGGNAMQFLDSLITNPNTFVTTNPIDGLDWTLQSPNGQRAGEMFPMQATEVLISACGRGCMPIVRGMLAAGTDINQHSKYGYTPLMQASSTGMIDVINTLVSNGANVSFVNSKNETSLLVASEYKQWSAAVVLLQHIMKTEAEQNSYTDEAFEIALQHHGVKFLQFVAEHDRHAHDTLVSKVSFHDACKHGYDLVVKHHTLHHNYSQNNIIDGVKIAFHNCHSNVLHALMPHLTNISVSELITLAYQQGQYNFAHELFESCTDHSTLPCPGISIADACKVRQVGLVEFLIKHGKDVNKAADELGYLLKYAPEDVHTLLRVWKASTKDNQTDDMYGPLNVDTLLGAVNDHNCHPPLVYASMQGDIAVVKLLLKHGADVNSCSDESPLTAACKHGHAEVVDILLCKTQSPSICQTNMYGMTPLQVAVKHHQGVIARRLIDSYEADVNAYKVPNTELIEITLTPRQGLLKSLSVVKLQTISQYITSIVPEQSSCWKMFLDPIQTEDARTPPIVIAFQSNQYDLAKFFIERSADYQVIFEHATPEDISQLESVPLMQQFIHSQLHPTQIDYETVLDVVAKVGNVDLMTYFLSQDQIFTSALAKAMIQACQQGSQDMVHLLIQHDECLVKSIQHDVNHDICLHPLCIAIRNSDVDIAVALYKSGAQLFNALKSETPVHHVLCEGSLKHLCQNEFSDILPQLLPECIDQSSLTSALIVACEARCTRAARLLVSKCADVNGCDKEGVSPLLAAVLAQSSQLVALLLTAGADPNKGIYENKTVLFIACDQDQFEIASKLIDAGANTNPECCSPLWIACQRNYIDIVELLLENSADPNQSLPEGHILNRVQKLMPCRYELERLFLEYRADPSVLSGIGLKTACELGYTEVVHNIIQESHVSHDMMKQCIEGAYKNGFLEAALEAIIDADNQEVKECSIQLVNDRLLNGTFTINAPEFSCMTNSVSIVSDDMSLWRCLEKRDIPTMRMLISGGQDVNIPNVPGRSLLQECILHRITHVIPDLCASQIHIDHRDSAGRTALFYSLTSPNINTKHVDSISVFEYLISKGADVNVRDYFGRSLLHEWQPAADGLNHGASLEALLKHIDINSIDHKGQTALHLAVLNNNIIAVRQLLEHGGNMEINDINHITPLLLAHNNHAILHAVNDYADFENKLQYSQFGKKDHRQCVYMLRDISKQHRLVPALKKVFHERAKYTQTDYFMSKYETRVYFTMQRAIREEKVLFEETVLQMLRAINAMVIQEEPVLSFTPRLSGSCAEGTKVIAVDEADILCVFDDDSWKHITLSQVSNGAHIQANPSLVQINAMPTKHQTLLNEGYVSKRKLLQRLYSLIRNALPTVLKDIKSLYMIDVKNAVANDHSLACLSMVWHGKVLPWQEFTVDVVPAIPVTQEQLPDGTRQVMSHSHIIQDLFVVPKTGTFDQSRNDAAFRLSFSSTERDLFLAMPTALKQGYMLTKVLVHDCITIDNIPVVVCSYNLKTATFECFKSEVLNWEELVIESRKTGTDNAKVHAAPEDVVRHAQNILQKVEQSFAQKHQSSFFLRGCDLMIHSIDKLDYRQMLYVKYSEAVLSDTDEAVWQQLAECVAQQLLKPKNMQESSFSHEIEILLGMGLKLQNNIFCEMIMLGQVEGVKMMLERGASTTNVHGNHMTAFEVAQFHRRHETNTDATDVLRFLEDNVKGKRYMYLSVIVSISIRIRIE